MFELFARPEHVPLWQDAADGKPDWPTLFAGYRSAIDWPTAAFWRELAAAYPNAKLIHSERPEDDWYRSFSNTIQQTMRFERPDMPPGWFVMASQIIDEGEFGGSIEDEEAVRAAYRQRNADVRAEIDERRLLILDPGAGWEPLCAFLGVPVPDKPYPHANTTEAFQQRVAARGGN